MQIRVATLLTVVFMGTVAASAQDVTPPPGFVPGQAFDSPSGTASPPFLSRENSTPRQDVFPDQNSTYPGAVDPYRPIPYSTSPGPMLAPGPILYPADVTPIPRFWFRA